MNRFLQIVLLLTFCCSQLFAQHSNSVDHLINISIPVVALVDFQGSDRTVTSNSPTEGEKSVEQIVTESTNDNTWLNYSSIVPEGVTNYITAYISDGSLPSATSINLRIGEDVSAGAGATGIPGKKIILSRYPQNIITDIGSCYTGRGTNMGHQLFFSLNGEDLNVEMPNNNEYSISVTYTIASTD